MPHVHDWASADAFLRQGRTARSRRSRRLPGRATYIVRDPFHDDDIGIVYHTTAVVTYHKDGTATLDTGEWDTVTTWRRIRYYGGPVYKHRGYDYIVNGSQRTAVYYDGIKVVSRTGAPA